jgi:hypothetical protein
MPGSVPRHAFPVVFAACWVAKITGNALAMMEATWRAARYGKVSRR